MEASSELQNDPNPDFSMYTVMCIFFNFST